jgi:hypothetical protein
VAKGHYRTSRVSKFQELAQAGVSASGKLLYFYFALGPFSSFAGIGRVSLDTTASDTGLSRAEIATALAELEKRPTPSRSFIVYDRERHIVWVRDYLKDDPAREKDANICNETHRKGIFRTLGDLPKDSPAVRKFKLYYHLTRHTPTRGPAGGTGGGVEVPTTYTEYNKQLPIPTSDRERETKGEASAARPVGGAPPPHDHNPPDSECTQRRRAHRAHLMARVGISFNQADTEAGRIVAGEVLAYRRSGAWPVPTESLPNGGQP